MFSIRNKKTPTNFQSRKKINWEYYNPPEDSSAVQFCLDSSLHGLQYVTQKNRHSFERSFWIIAFLASVVCAGLLIHTLWQTYSDSPVVTVINPELLQQWQIPFPSVSFCNVNKIKKSKKEEYERNAFSSKDTNNDTKYLESLAAIADLKDMYEQNTFTKYMFDKVGYRLKYFDEFNDELKSRWNDYKHLLNPSKRLHDISHDCNEMFVFCMWNGDPEDCDKIFRPILTDYGYCCTFNMIPINLLRKTNDSSTNDTTNDPIYNEGVRDWKELNSENLMLDRNVKGIPFFPERQTYPNRATGLSVMLEPNLEEYFCTNLDSEGFVVGLNLPIDYPRVKDNGMLVEPGKETFIKLQPQITIAQKSIRAFDIEKRFCVFEDDTEHTVLKYYTKYSANNCFEECLSDAVKLTCGCVRYYMSRSPDTPLCQSDQNACLTHVEKYTQNDGKLCHHCHHTCTDILYLAEITSLRIQKARQLQLVDAYPERNWTNDVAIVHLYFDQSAYQTRLKKDIFTIIELISSTGGLLGLCLGFSMLSLLEIIYFFTIRLCFIYRRKCVEKSKIKTMDLRVASDYGERDQKHLTKQWAVSVGPTASKECQDPILKLVQSRSAWKLRI